jgi:hypothetical protein
MLASEIDMVEQIARYIAREEITKALAAYQKPVAAIVAAPEPEKEPAPGVSHHKKH